MSFLFGKFYQIQLGLKRLPNLQRNSILAGIMACLLAIVGFSQSWNLAFSLLNMCLISAIMALGVNIQWGYAGLFNAGCHGFRCSWRISSGFNCSGSSKSRLGSWRSGSFIWFLALAF